MTIEELIKGIKSQLSWPKSVSYCISAYDGSYALEQIDKLIIKYESEETRSQSDEADLPLEILRKVRSSSSEE